MSTKEEESVTAEQPGKPAPIEIKSLDGELTLRQFTLEDAQDIFALIDGNRAFLSQNGEDTARKYPTFYSVAKSIVEPPNPKRLRFAIRNAKGQLVGSINLTPDEDDPSKGEVGYYLGEKFTGKGYATRAAETLTRYGFKHLGYREIFGVVADTNGASLKVLKNLGYTETGRKVEDGLNKKVLTRFRSAH